MHSFVHAFKLRQQTALASVAGIGSHLQQFCCGWQPLPGMENVSYPRVPDGLDWLSLDYCALADERSARQTQWCTLLLLRGTGLAQHPLRATCETAVTDPWVCRSIRGDGGRNSGAV